MQETRIFLDSNVLLYARDRELSVKAETSSRWLIMAVSLGAACANLQVLNEVTNVMLRKRGDLDPAEVFAAIEELNFLGLTPIGQSTIEKARKIHLETKYSWWDCVLLASALELGCTHFLSEDLQDGQIVADSSGRRLTIVDPFVHSPEQIFQS